MVTFAVVLSFGIVLSTTNLQKKGFVFLFYSLWATKKDYVNLVYGLVLHEFSVAQVDRAPAQCLGGYRFESCWGLRLVFVPSS